jgi:hypothetical protein
MCIFCKSVVHGSNICWRKDICYIRTEIEKIISRVRRVPVELLPGVGRVVKWTADFNYLLAYIAQHRVENPRGNAMVAAKSLISDRLSSPNIALNSLIAFWLFDATSESNLSTIALILAMQSDGPSF